jgi:hypothetical protein
MKENLKETLHELYASKKLIELSIQRIEKMLENEAESEQHIANEPVEELDVLKNVTECPIFVSGYKRQFDDFDLDKYTYKQDLSGSKLRSSNIRGLLEENKLKEISVKQMNEEIKNGELRKFPAPKDTSSKLRPLTKEEKESAQMKHFKKWQSSTECPPIEEYPPKIIIDSKNHDPKISNASKKSTRKEKIREQEKFKEELKDVNSDDLREALHRVFLDEIGEEVEAKKEEKVIKEENQKEVKQINEKFEKLYGQKLKGINDKGLRDEFIKLFFNQEREKLNKKRESRRNKRRNCRKKKYRKQ